MSEYIENAKKLGKMVAGHDKTVNHKYSLPEEAEKHKRK